MLVKESYFMIVQAKFYLKNKIDEYFTMTGIGIVMDSFLFTLIMILTWGGSLTLSMSVLICFVMIQQVLTTWVYIHSGKNILGSTIFLSMLYAWMMVNFFPFGLMH